MIPDCADRALLTAQAAALPTGSATAGSRSGDLTGRFFLFGRWQRRMTLPCTAGCAGWTGFLCTCSSM